MAALNYYDLFPAWAYQTGTFNMEAVRMLFDGNKDTVKIPSFARSLTNQTEIHLMLPPGTTTAGIRLYDESGSASGDGTSILRVYRRLKGQLSFLPVNHQEGQNVFDGSGYQKWWNYTWTATDAVAEVILVAEGRKVTWPQQAEWMGASTTYVTPARTVRPARLDNKGFINTYWYNLYDPANVHGPVDAAKAAQLSRYNGGRYYVPCQNIMDGDEIRVSPSLNGGAHYDGIQEWWNNQGKPTIMCLMGNSPANIQSFVDHQADAAFLNEPTLPEHPDNNPRRDAYDIGSNAMWAWGADLTNPESFRWIGVQVWQWVARYATKTWAFSLLKHATTAKPSYDPVHQKKTALGYLAPGKGYLQIGNELAKVWKLLLAHLGPKGAAVMWAVIRDGFKNTMGPGVGALNADPTIESQLLLGILFSADASYLLAFAEEVRAIYGSNEDGSVKGMPALIDVHEYARRSSDGGGVPFQESPLPARFDAFDTVLRRVAPNSRGLLSEFGYVKYPEASGFADDNSFHSGYSYLPAANGLTAEVRRAANSLGMAIFLALVYGFDLAVLYDDFHGTDPAPGVYWDLLADTNGTLTQSWFAQMTAFTAGFTAKSCTYTNGVLHGILGKTGQPDLHLVLGSGTASIPVAKASTRTTYAFQPTGNTATTSTAAQPAGTYAPVASEVPHFFRLVATTTEPTLVPLPTGSTLATDGILTITGLEVGKTGRVFFTTEEGKRKEVARIKWSKS